MEEDDFISIRQYLHQHPEVSEEEENTSAYIWEQIAQIWPGIAVEQVGKYGLIATTPKKEGVHIGIRCELDALPIHEVNDLPYRSVMNGVGHKCGHDGHMTILLRLLHLLKEDGLTNATVSLIFQSAEENGVGAREMIAKAKVLKEHPLDYIFALHNVPGYALHEIVLKDGVFTPSVISVKSRLLGKTSHAAEPQKGVNPGLAVAEMLQKVEAYGKQEDAEEKGLVMTTVYAQLGSESYGTSAGEAVVGFTMRTTTYEHLKEVMSWYEKTVNEVVGRYGLKLDNEWFEEFPSIVNDAAANRIVQAASEKLGLKTQVKEQPFPFGEDFGFFTQQTTGGMFGLGSGLNTPALHNPDYDFPDELIVTGSDLFFRIIKEIKDD